MNLICLNYSGIHRVRVCILPISIVSIKPGTAVVVTYLCSTLVYFIESDSCFVNSREPFIVRNSYFIRGKGELVNVH